MYPDILNDICLAIPIVIFFDRSHHTLLTLALRIWARGARLISNICLTIMHIFAPEWVFSVLLLWIQLWLGSLEIRMRCLIIKLFTSFVDRFTFLFISGRIFFKKLLLTSFVRVLFSLVVILAENVILLRRTCKSWLWWYLLECWWHWLAMCFDAFLATLIILLFWSRIFSGLSWVVVQILTGLMPVRLPWRFLKMIWRLFLFRFMTLIWSRGIKSLRWLFRHHLWPSNLRLVTALYGCSVSLA